MKTSFRTLLLSLSLTLAAAACDSPDENDNAGCTGGGPREATIVAIEQASSGTCDAPVIVLFDVVDPKTGETTDSGIAIYDGPVPQAWLDDQGIEVGDVLDVYQARWCEGGGLDLVSEDYPPPC